MAHSPSQIQIPQRGDDNNPRGSHPFCMADRHWSRGKARAVLPPSSDLPISASEHDIKKEMGELSQAVNQLLAKQNHSQWLCPRDEWHRQWRRVLPANFSGRFSCGSLDHMQCDCQVRRPLMLGNDFQAGLQAETWLPPPIQGSWTLHPTVKNVADTDDGPLVKGSVLGVEETFLMDTGVDVTCHKCKAFCDEKDSCIGTTTPYPPPPPPFLLITAPFQFRPGMFQNSDRGWTGCTWCWRNFPNGYRSPCYNCKALCGERDSCIGTTTPWTTPSCWWPIPGMLQCLGHGDRAGRDH